LIQAQTDMMTQRCGAEGRLRDRRNDLRPAQTPLPAWRLGLGQGMGHPALALQQAASAGSCAQLRAPRSASARSIHASRSCRPARRRPSACTGFHGPVFHGEPAHAQSHAAAAQPHVHNALGTQAAPGCTRPAAHRSVTRTAVTESANALMLWMGSKERERMSHTRTAWSYPPLTTVSSPGPQHSCSSIRARSMPQRRKFRRRAAPSRSAHVRGQPLQAGLTTSNACRTVQVMVTPERAMPGAHRTGNARGTPCLLCRRARGTCGWCALWQRPRQTPACPRRLTPAWRPGSPRCLSTSCSLSAAANRATPKFNMLQTLQRTCCCPATPPRHGRHSRALHASAGWVVSTSCASGACDPGVHGHMRG